MSNLGTSGISDEILQRCPCLGSSPYSAEVRELLAIKAPPSSDWDLHKILAVYRMCFHFRKIEEDLPTNPVADFANLLKDITGYLRLAVETAPPFLYQSPKAKNTSIESVTADHYGQLFSCFTEEKYYEEPTKLLFQRLKRNGFDLSWLEGKRVLDAGCGNGRYTYALSNLGAADVIGLDISQTNLVDARKRLQKRPRDGISYQHGSALKMPFQDESFDFVFSNGVLHHTPDIDAGLRELVRVLKPNGRGFLMLINDPGGIKWDMIEICREILRDVSYQNAHDIFLKLNMPPHLRFLYLDHILVPINTRLTAEAITDKLVQSGAIEITRLERGADVDELEKFAGYAAKDALWGSGIHRFFFSKA